MHKRFASIGFPTSHQKTQKGKRHRPPSLHLSVTLLWPVSGPCHSPDRRSPTFDSPLFGFAPAASRASLISRREVPGNRRNQLRPSNLHRFTHRNFPFKKSKKGSAGLSLATGHRPPAPYSYLNASIGSSM